MQNARAAHLALAGIEPPELEIFLEHPGEEHIHAHGHDHDHDHGHRR